MANCHFAQSVLIYFKKGGIKVGSTIESFVEQLEWVRQHATEIRFDYHYLPEDKSVSIQYEDYPIRIVEVDPYVLYFVNGFFREWASVWKSLWQQYGEKFYFVDAHSRLVVTPKEADKARNFLNKGFTLFYRPQQERGIKGEKCFTLQHFEYLHPHYKYIAVEHKEHWTVTKWLHVSTDTSDMVPTDSCVSCTLEEKREVKSLLQTSTQSRREEEELLYELEEWIEGLGYLAWNDGSSIRFTIMNRHFDASMSVCEITRMKGLLLRQKGKRELFLMKEAKKTIPQPFKKLINQLIREERYIERLGGKIIIGKKISSS